MNEFFSSSSYKGGNRVVRHYLLRAFKNKQELIIVEVPAAKIDSPVLEVPALVSLFIFYKPDIQIRLCTSILKSE